MSNINFDPKILVAIFLIGIIVLLFIFGEFVLPLAIILIPVAIIFGVMQLKKN